MQKTKLQFKIQNFYFLVIVFSFAFFVFNFTEAEAAKLTLGSQIQEIAPGQQFQIDLLLDTENEEINAIEGKILFPEDLLELKEIRDGNSAINFWIEQPRLEKDGIIVFSGITPGGLYGEKELLFSTILQTKAEGNGTIEIRDVRALLNDGQGTSAKTTISNFQFSISKEVPGFEFQVPGFKDTDPPEEFKPEIAQNPEIFDGKWFLVFATQDKGSGIDYYEVQEKREYEIKSFDLKMVYPDPKSSWVRAESPYLLRDQELKSYISVKTVDKSGNERIVTLAPQNPISWHENYLIWLIIILVTIIIIITGAIGLYIRKKILWKGKIN